MTQNDTDTSNVDEESVERKRVSCPACLYSISIGKAYKGKSGHMLDPAFDEAFRCPKCKEPLALCKSTLSGYYFIHNVRKPDYSNRGYDA